MGEAVRDADMEVLLGRWYDRCAVIHDEQVMTKGEAMRTPIVGSCVLGGLYLLLKWGYRDIVLALLKVGCVSGLAVSRF